MGADTLTPARRLAVAAILVVALGSLAAGACDAPADAERCANIEDRLSAELRTVASACRQDVDCHPIQLHCRTPWATGAAAPISVTRLAKQFEDLGCCGSLEIWDGCTPRDLPAVGCTEGPASDDNAGSKNMCAVRDAVRCSGGCRVIEGCSDGDVEGWLDHEDGCEAGCEEALLGHPARTQRMLRCITDQGCAGAGNCGAISEDGKAPCESP